MIHNAETLLLRDGGSFVIRSVEPEDAPRMLQYMKNMLGETPFLLRTPEEFDYTPEEEAQILDKRKNDPRSLMLLAEKDGQIIACADVQSHGNKSRVWHRAELGISVRKDFWHQGIGSALMERLISAAEIVHEDSEARVVETVKDTAEIRGIIKHYALGYLDVYSRGRHIVLGESL